MQFGMGIGVQAESLIEYVKESGILRSIVRLWLHGGRRGGARQSAAHVSQAVAAVHPPGERHDPVRWRRRKYTGVLDL